MEKDTLAIFSKINGILVQQCVEFMNLQEDNCM